MNMQLLWMLCVEFWLPAVWGEWWGAQRGLSAPHAWLGSL